MQFFSRKNMAIFAAVFFVLIAASFFLRIYLSKKTDIKPPELERVHYYNNPVVSLSNINVKVFYVVPKGASVSLLENWKDIISGSFKKINRFHSVQFLGKSAISFSVYPQPIFLDESASHYNAPGILNANFEGLMELEENTLAAANIRSETSLDGFLKTPPNHYPLLFFVYEGRGAGGDRGRAYVPASIFADNDLRNVKEAIMYHSLGHALGFKDEESQDEPVSSDGIMGLGLLRPLEINFVESSILRKMGLLGAK